MAWLVTLASKLTGKEIPGVAKSAPGGKVIMEQEECATHIQNIVAIADTMSKKAKWGDRPDDNFILEEMLEDIKLMVAK